MTIFFFYGVQPVFFFVLRSCLLCRMIMVIQSDIFIELKYILTLERSAYEMDSYSGAVPKPAIEDIVVHGRETASGSGATEPTR